MFNDNNSVYSSSSVISIPHWPLPAVRDLTRDGRWITCDVSVLKLSNVSFRGKCARMGNSIKLLSPTKLARLGHFPPASQAGRLAGPVFYVYVFSLVISFIMWTRITGKDGTCPSPVRHRHPPLPVHARPLPQNGPLGRRRITLCLLYNKQCSGSVRFWASQACYLYRSGYFHQQISTLIYDVYWLLHDLYYIWRLI